jgi:hypothetical protein
MGRLKFELFFFATIQASKVCFHVIVLANLLRQSFRAKTHIRAMRKFLFSVEHEKTINNYLFLTYHVEYYVVFNETVMHFDEAKTTTFRSNVHVVEKPISGLAVCRTPVACSVVFVSTNLLANSICDCTSSTARATDES